VSFVAKETAVRRTLSQPLLCAACLLAWGLRLAMVAAHRLHPDEALYGHWGLLILSGRDPWLVGEPVYKPPLLPYLLAGSLALLGRSEWALRLPGVFAGTVAVALTARLARSLYGGSVTGLAAAWVTALLPFAFLFSATAFTDPLMVTLGLAGCAAAAAGRPGWAGVLAGLSVAAKQTGVAWLPLAGLLVLASAVRHPRPGGTARALARWLAGGLAVVAVLVAWDRLRVAQGATSFWGAGVTGYGGLRLAWPAELTPRLRAWLGLGRALFGSPLLDVLFVAGAAALVWRGLRRRDWPALFDLLWVGFGLLYLLVHWLWAFPVWDRYLLPLVAVVAMVLGRTVSVGLRSLRPRAAVTGLVVLLLAVSLMASAANGLSGRIPVGAGQSTYDGIERVAAFLRGLPEGTVLYHHWLGWEYGFYLFDAPLYLAYWPDPAWLARDVQAFGETGPRTIVFPAWESSARVEAALADVGYRLQRVFSVGDRFRVYAVRP
jgi:4-amino-4-deoxy-L-arabinose transferase-like glycosyltransferase